MLDILFSVFLLVFGIVCYINVGSCPEGTATELGAAFWPQIILVAMCALLVVNTVFAIKKYKTLDDSKKGLDIKGFFTSKLFIGMVFVIIMALIHPEIGFIPTCIIFLFVYGILLGEKNYAKNAIVAVVLTIILYVTFQGVLDIMLARGVGPFRSFAMMCERILPF